MKGLRIDAIMPWEIGLFIIIIGIILIIIGNRQSKKKDFDLEKIFFIRPTTKIIFGSSLILVGLIQLIPLIKN